MMTDESGKEDLHDEEEDMKLAALEAALSEGDACDPADDVDGETSLLRVRQRIVDRAKTMKKRPLGMFYKPGFVIPADFDELPEDELKAWNGDDSSAERRADGNPLNDEIEYSDSKELMAVVKCGAGHLMRAKDYGEHQGWSDTRTVRNVSVQDVHELEEIEASHIAQIEAGLADAEAGRVVPHAEVMAEIQRRRQL